MRPRTIRLTLALAALLAAVALLILTSHDSGRRPERFRGPREVSLPPSELTLPLTLPYPLLASWLDQAFDGETLEKTLTVAKASSEKITLRLAKSGPASLSAHNGELHCTLPLQVRATLVESSLGDAFTNLVRPLEAEARLTLATPLALTPDWHLATRFRIVSVHFTREPVLWIGPLGLNLTGAVERMLAMESDKIGRQFDTQAAALEEVRLRLEAGWNKLQQPIPLGTPAFPAWLLVSPDSLKASLETRTEGLLCRMAVNGTLQATTDTTAMKPPRPLPPYRKIDTPSPDRQGSIALLASIPFKELDRRLEAALTDRELRAGPYNAIITNIETYATPNGIAAAITTRGALPGTLYLSGTPTIDEASQAVLLEEFETSLAATPKAGSAEALLRPALYSLLAPYSRLELAAPLARLHENAATIPGLRLDSIRITRMESLPDQQMLYLLLHAEILPGAAVAEPGDSSTRTSSPPRSDRQ